eukprot:UN21572
MWRHQYRISLLVQLKSTDQLPMKTWTSLRNPSQKLLDIHESEIDLYLNDDGVLDISIISDT